jgi:hypothetical protein
LTSAIDVMRSDFGLDVRPLEHVECYDLTKGKRLTLHLAVVRVDYLDPSGGPAALPTASGAPLKQSLVK